MAINGTLYKSMGYATADIRPAAIAGSAPEAIVVHPSNPAKNSAEFIQTAKSGPMCSWSAPTRYFAIVAYNCLRWQHVIQYPPCIPLAIMPKPAD